MTFLPILYKADETAFDSFGLGRMVACKSCTVSETMNSDNYDLSASYPITEQLAPELTVDRIIVAKGNKSADRAQPFRIYYAETVLQDGTVNVKASHDCLHRMKNCITAPGEITGTIKTVLAALRSGAITKSGEPWPFTFVSNLDTEATVSLTTPVSLYDAIYDSENGILAKFGGEIHLDWYTVTINKSRGGNHGVTVRESSNMVSLTKVADASSVVTGVIPYYSQKDEDDNVTLVYADPPVISVEKPELVYSHLVAVDCTSDIKKPDWAADNWVPTSETLEEYGQLYLAKNYSGTVPVTFAAGIVNDMSSVSGDIALGDIVRLLSRSTSTRLEAQVSGTEYDVLSDEYTSIEIGTVRTNLAQTIVDLTNTKTKVEKVSFSARSGSSGYFRWTFNKGLSMVDVAASVPKNVTLNKYNRYTASFSIAIPSDLDYIDSWTIESSDGQFISENENAVTVTVTGVSGSAITCTVKTTAATTLNGQLYVHYRAISTDIENKWYSGWKDWKSKTYQIAYADCLLKSRLFYLYPNSSKTWALAQCDSKYIVLQQVGSYYYAGFTAEAGGATGVKSITAGALWKSTKAVPLYSQQYRRTKIATIPANTECRCLAIAGGVFLVVWAESATNHRVGWTNVSGGLLDDEEESST